ncbi:MAG TPA: SdpI family protein [Devosiaceae bacterium]|nr:SdpI family protein [Devosiaceae bacterium]
MDRKPLVTRLHLTLFGVLVAITAVAFVKIPAAIGLPVHWGLDGRPDQVWPRNEALLVFPAIGLVLTGVFAAIGQFAPVEQVEPGRHISEAMLLVLLGLLAALEFSLILIGVGSDIDMVRIVAFGVATLLIVLGNVLPRSQPNAYAGVRLPWTLKDPGNWAATHRLTGVLFIVAGAGLAAVAWFRPDPADMLPAIGIAIFLPLLVGGLFSFSRGRG